jgi:hypothetical protein
MGRPDRIVMVVTPAKAGGQGLEVMAAIPTG